jgi:hypothetical protein
MTDNDFQKRVQHFAALKSKYQASDYKDSSPSSPLYLILRKTDLGIELTEFELNWLKEQKLHQTSQFISQKRVLSSEKLLLRQIWNTRASVGCVLRTINPYTDEPRSKFLGINGKSIKTKT